MLECTGNDTEPPTASNPANITAECIAPEPDPSVVTDEADNCPGPIIITFVNDVSDNNTCPELITRTYSVTDNSGNSITVTQLITVHDLTDPGIVCPTNIQIEAGSSEDPSATGNPTSVDNCDSDPEFIFFDNLIPGTCPIVNTIERSWAAVDDCGNTTFCTQLIDLLDTSNPVISCPATTTVEAGDQELPQVTGFPTATDNADQNLDIDYIDDITFTGTCPVSRIIERTWTATDDCGNASQCVQTINTTDLTNPVITCPADITINGNESDQPSNTGEPVVMDDGDPNVNVTFSDNVTTVGTCPAINIIDRVFTATDICGNTSTCSQEITVVNLTAPQVLCPDNPNGALLDIFENEPNEVASDIGVITITLESSLGGSVGLPASDMVDHWIIDDGTHGEVTVSFELSLHPLTIAAVTCYSDPERTIMITSEAVLPFDPPITVSLDSTLFYSLVIQNPLAVGEPYDVLITGPALASSTNETTLECPPNFNPVPVGPNVPQHPSIHPNATGMASIIGNPGPGVTISYQDVLTGPTLENCPEVWTVERTWTAMDDCGQFTTCTEFFNFNDFTQPILNCPDNVTVDSGADTQPASTGFATASDNCDPNVDLTFADVVSNPGTCIALTSIERTWTAVDDCGNANICTQIIDIGDFTPPSINCPPNITITCIDDDQPPATGTATAFDLVDPLVDITFFDNVSTTGNCPVFETIQRTWSAIDNCGNSSPCLQIINIIDDDDPLIACPANVTVECGTSINPTETGNPTTFDNCGNLQISFSNNTTSGCGATGTVTRTWTATDICNNTSSCVQVITIEDTSPPTVFCPLDITIECGLPTTPPATGTANANDNCGMVTVDFSDSTVSSCGLSGVITRTWTAMDECGNTNSCNQILTISDNAGPILTCPDNITVECGTSLDPGVIGQATGTDACGTFQITFSDQTTPACGATGFITRTFTATDQCGNVSDCDQMIIIEDLTLPTLTCPPSVNLECGDAYDPNVTGMATGTDACGGVFISFTDDIVPNCPSAQVLSRFWIGLDDCGNISSCIQTISFGDPPPPELTCPFDITLQCGQSIDPIDIGEATTILGCGNDLITYEDEIAAGCAQTGIITRTWTVVDGCNNVVTCDQVITIIDNAPPVITCPDNIVVECGDSTDPSATGVVTGTDACGTITTSSSDFFVTGCGSSGTIIRTWTVTDECSNFLTCPQLITIDDTSGPAITCPDNTVVSCGGSIDPLDTGMATAVDACGTFTINFSDDVVPICPGTPSLTRTWTANDQCGNQSSCDQIISLDDSPPPVIVCPPDVFQECGLSIDPIDTGTATTLFGCGVVEILYFDNFITVCGGSGTIIRTWSGIDECDNLVSCTQSIILIDTTPPSITCPPPITVDCSVALDPPITGDPIINETCGSFTKFFTDMPGTGCGDSGLLIRTWSAVDGCNNSSNCQQFITVTSEVSVEIVCPSDTSVLFGNSTDPMDLGDAVWPGGCGTTSINSFDTVFPVCADASTILRLWTGTDDCGNTSECIQRIDVDDLSIIQLSAVVTNQMNFSMPDGEIDLTPSSGAPQYSYQWSTGATTEDLTNLPGPIEYSVTVSDHTGCEVTASYFVDSEAMSEVELCVSVFMASLFDPFALPPTPPMVTTLRNMNLIPLEQPFDEAPWNYNGPESFPDEASVPPDMVDWLLLRLRPQSDPTLIAYEAAVVLLSDGTITDLTGSLPILSIDPVDNYWLELSHLNHLPIVTDGALIIPAQGGQLCHDFTSSMSMAYNNPALSNDPMAELPGLGGVSYGMIPGNVQNLDCNVDANDLNLLFINYLTSGSYTPWDINRDGNADINDVNMLFTYYLSICHRPY